MMAMQPTSGFSQEADLLSRAANAVRRRQRLSTAFGRQEAFDQLGEVWSECSQENWDGHGALPIAADTLRETYCLLETMPDNIPSPSLGAEPDGHLTLEWHRSRRRTLSVSVTPNGELHYAALLGPNREYGTEAHFGELPVRILELVERLFRK